ncbi:hypothetical protein Gotur_019084 [Gossypium turneri]
MCDHRQISTGSRLTTLQDHKPHMTDITRDGDHLTAFGSNDDDGFREQDRLLPIANVGRIMKQMLPPNAKISKEAKETMQECVSEFISFVTSEASDKCRKERRKTINGEDICWALATLGFDDYAAPLRRYLNKYREVEGDNKAANQDKVNNNSDEGKHDWKQ